MDQIIQLGNEIEELRRQLKDKEMKLALLQANYNLTNNVPKLKDNNSDAVQCGELTTSQIERYSRQILLREIGVPGQTKICSAKVLIVGAGGLGCPAAMYLAGAGVETIGIVDYDEVEITNIHRQLLHKQRNVGKNKAESAAEAIKEINPQMTVYSYKVQLNSYNAFEIAAQYDVVLDCTDNAPTRYAYTQYQINPQVTVYSYKVQLNSYNAFEIAAQYDVVLDCTDNAPTRYLLSDLCVLAKKPLISGSALKLEGQLTVYCYRSDLHSAEKNGTYRGPCYRCLFATPPSSDAMGSCSQNGVAGPVPGVIGTLQAMEALKLIIGYPSKNLLVGRMFLLDVDDMATKVVQLRQRNPTCAVCSDTPTITQLIDYEVFCKTLAKEKNRESVQKSEKRKLEKEKRMSGRSYYGFRTHTDGTKKKYIQDVLKAERKLGPTCKSDICNKNPDKYCQKLTEADRESIFRHFWQLDWREKKQFVKSLINLVPPKRRRSTHIGLKSRKGDSKRYNLILSGKKLPVCRVTFLNTLGIKEAMVRCWSSDTRAKITKTPIKSLSVVNYIDSLPKMDPKCQFCLNNNIETKYIDLNVKNQFQLYNIYVKCMKSEGINPASRKTFDKVLIKKKIRIFKPKNERDVCDLVSQHNVGMSFQSEKIDAYYFNNIEEWS